MAADDQPWDLTQTAAPAAPPPPPPSAAPAAGAAPIDYSAIVQRLMQQPTLPQPDTTPVKRGWLSLLGEAIGGGQTTGVMSPAQSETAGLRALRDFGTSLIAGSGYHPGQPALGAFATGFQGAEQSERGSEQGAAATLAAQQQYAAGQQQQYLERLKTALPLLQMQQFNAARDTALGRSPAVPGTATGAGGGTYESTITGMEGTGKNPNSSSSGVGGFLDSTWQDFASANPDLFKGMTPAQVMAAKSDPGLGAKAITWLAQRNAGVLGSSNIAPTGQSLGIAHYVGPGPAAKIMAAPDNAPVSGFVSPQAVQANPELQTMTAGQMKQRYAGVPTPGFLKPAGGPAASAAPLPAPVKVAGPGAPTGGSTPATPDTTPWDLPGNPAAPATPPVAPPTTPPVATPPVTQQPPPDRVPPTFTYTRQPLPPDIQSRIDNPPIPPQYDTAVQTALTPEALQTAQNNKAAAIAAAKAKAIDEGEAWQTKQQEIGADVHKQNLTIQQQKDKALQDIEQANATAAATRAQEERMATINSANTRVNAEAAKQTDRNGEIAKTYGTARDSGIGIISAIDQLGPVLQNLPEGPAPLLKNEQTRSTLASLFGWSDPELVKHVDAADWFDQGMNRVATLLSPLAPAGTERASQVSQYRAILPTLAQSAEGREFGLQYARDLAKNQVDSMNWLTMHKEDPQYMNKRLGVPDGDMALIGLQSAPDAPKMPKMPPIPSSFDPAKVTPSDAAAQAKYQASITPGQPYYAWQTGGDGHLHAVRYDWQTGQDGQMRAVPSSGGR